jgi:uncharacterized surface protein with fasciclin (FAS1) repeats
MKKLYLTALAAALVAGTSALVAPGLSQAQEKTVTVGGAPMYPSKNIVENAVNSKDHTTLVAAVKAAGLAETLSGKGPFTSSRRRMTPSPSSRPARSTRS